MRRKMEIGSIGKGKMKLPAMRICQQDCSGDAMYDGDDALLIITKIASCNGTSDEVVWESLRDGEMIRTCAARYYAPDFARG